MRFVLGIARRFVSSTRSRARQNGLHIFATAIVLLYIVSFPLIPPLEAAEFGAPRLTVQTAHADHIAKSVYSPNGKWLVTIGGLIAKLWEVEAALEIREFSGHSAPLTDVVFVGSDIIATAGLDASIRLWNLADGSLLKQIDLDYTPWYLAADRIGRLLAATENDAIRVWDIQSGRPIAQINVINPGRIEFLGDTSLLLFSGYEQKIAVVDVLRPALRASVFPVGERSDVSADREGTIVSDGRYAINLKGGKVLGPYLWNFRGREGGGSLSELSRRAREEMNSRSEPSSISVSADGGVLAIRTNSRLGLWDITKPDSAVAQREIGTAPSILTNLRDLPKPAFSPNSKHVLLPVGSIPTAFHIPTLEMAKQFRSFTAGIDSVVADRKTQRLAVLDKSSRLSVWDMKTGSRVFGLEEVSAIALDQANSTLVIARSSNGFLKLDLASLESTSATAFTNIRVKMASLSPDGKMLLALDSEGNARLIDFHSGTERIIQRDAISIAFSPDGKQIAIGADERTVHIINIFSGERKQLTVEPVITEGENVVGLSFSGSGDAVLAVGDHRAILWDIETGQHTSYFRPKGRVRATGHALDYTILTTAGQVLPDGRLLLGSSDGTAHLWRKNAPVADLVFEGHSAPVTTVTALNEQDVIITGSADGTVRLWSALDGRPLLNIVPASDNKSLVTDSIGRFDADLLDGQVGVAWVMPDDPLRPLPPELFMRDYFEPRLLVRLLACEEGKRTRADACEREFKKVRPLAALNRAQPDVKIVSIVAEPGAEDEVAITVEVAAVERRFGSGGEERTWQSGVYDLRLFRNSQLVGQAPDIKTPEPLEALDPAADLARWREAHRVVGDLGIRHITFRNIRLPRDKSGKVEFSAYAFNADRVKSATASSAYTVPDSAPSRPPRAYVIAVGVSAYQDAAWDLKYADRDASRFVAVLEPRLRATGRYQEVVTVPLLAGWERQDGQRRVTVADASKEKFKAVLDILAGRSVSEEMRRSIPNAAELQRARPDDLVLIAYSSHGYADQAGNFYLFPYDIGSNVGRSVSEEILQRGISSAELSLWMRDIDAGELVMVVDACHSAASVESSEFKPGPMGARGLGQLAYDKGMRILASTRADDVAWETDRTQQGLLSYALVHEGLEQGKADFRPSDGGIGVQEWLEYGAERVPQLYAETFGARRTQHDAAAPRLVVFDAASHTSRQFERLDTRAARFTQQPALFSYKRGKDMLFVKR